MKLKISHTSKLLLLSVGFTMSMFVLRCLYDGTLTYGFYAWNTFLAAIPYFISTQLLQRSKINFASFTLLATWLLFFPNAPYIITDVLHYQERPPVPYWYDLILVVSAAWNGLILGLISLMNVEIFLNRHLKPVMVKALVCISFFLCGYGVFIGRFLRFNSWDIVSDPGNLAYTSAHHIFFPQHYPKLWVFTSLFAVMLGIIYFTLQLLPKVIVKKSP